MSKTDVVVRMLDPERITINPAYKTRKADHDEHSIEQIAKSMEYRHRMNNQPVQIMDIVVTPIPDKDGDYYLVDGEGRLGAIRAINEAGGLDDEPMQVRAKIVRGNSPEEILTTGLQANFHQAIDVFDQAEVAGKLLDLNKKQKEIAAILGVTEGRVSQILPLRTVAKKYIAAYREGDIEQDAVIAIANMDGDDQLKAAVMEEAVRHRDRITTILTRKEHENKKVEIKTRIEEAKSKVDEYSQTAKELDTAIKKVEKAAAKTEDTKELEQIRKEKAELDKQRKDAEKALRAATKELDKAKAEKEKLSEAPPPAKKVRASVEDIKQAAKDKGVKGADDSPAPRSKNTVYAELEALGSDENNPVPDSVKNLIGKLEAFFDGEISPKQLRNSFLFNCRSNDELARAKAAK